MDDALRELVHFVQSARGFDALQKIKLIVFASGVKNVAFVRLRIGSGNLGEKHHFEKHLKQARVLFRVSQAKTVEEITEVKKNWVVWRPNGLWFAYDLFCDVQTKKLFAQYESLLLQGLHARADALGAQLYGYPLCCQKEYTKEHDPAYIGRKYTAYEFYKKLHEVDEKFPFIFHSPCSLSCASTKRMNQQYKSLVKEYALRFYVSFVSSYSFTTELIVDTYAYLCDDVGKAVWPVRDGYDYSLLTRKPVQQKFFLLSYLTRKKLKRGTVFSASVTVRYDVPRIVLGRKVKEFKQLFHQRRLYLQP